MKNVACITLLAALLACAAPLAAQSKEALTPEAFLQMGHSDGILAVAYSPDGKQAASASYDNTVKVWDADSGRELRTLAGHSSRVESIAYSPDSRRIVSGSADMMIKIWDAEAGREIRTLTGHSGKVMSVAYSPDGRRIFSASGDRTLKIWDAETGREIRTLTGHSLGVETAVYSPDGRWIASGSNDKTIKIWDAETGREIKTLTGHNQALNAVSFSPDGRRIVSSDNGERDNIKIWDTETGGARRTISTGVFVYSARFSSDGGRIICSSDDHTVKIFDAATGREIRSLAGHGGAVFTVSYSPDGRRILSGSDDWTAKIWDAATGAEIMTLGIPAPLTRDMIAEYLALAGDSAAKTGAFSGPSLYRAGPRETALQFGAMASKTLAEIRFLDPQNSAALRRGEALLQSVASKGGVSRADMQDYLRQGIAAVVDKYYNQKGVFNITPSAVYASWKNTHGVDAVQIVKDTLTAFYLEPTARNFAAIRGIMASYNETDNEYGDTLAYVAGVAFSKALRELSDPLWETVVNDGRAANVALSASPNRGANLAVFSFRYNAR